MKNRAKNKNLFSSLKWIISVSQRFARVDRNGRSAATSILATLGICFGVMTLTVVMSVMNGFQMSFIDAIMEISSYHVRVNEMSAENEALFYEVCNSTKNVLSATGFYEAQTLMTGKKGKENAAIIRAVDPSIYTTDKGFFKQLDIYAGNFTLSQPDSIVLGSSLARKLGVTVGDNVNLLVLSGGSDVSLFSDDRNFKVTGIFNTGYSEINNSYSFINIKDGEKYFGASAKKIYGIKLKNSNDDMHTIAQLQKKVPDAKFQSWRDYNKTFFGALRIEKNMLLLLVALIFVVVAINIYNGMRRLVFERRSEIAILSALGATNSEIKSIFIMRGFTTGAVGAFIGVILGLAISVNTDVVFNMASSVMFWVQYFFTAIFNPNNLMYVQENSSYAIYANIPARIFFSEVVLIALFGLASPLIASWAASKNVLKLTVAEVLHDE
ncbi:MAG: ABC transporter permease [Treponema sp.]|nr:ABC transporter permease [Treponema sp.]